MDGFEEIAFTAKEISTQEFTYLCLVLSLLLCAFLLDAWNQRARRYALVR